MMKRFTLLISALIFSCAGLAQPYRTTSVGISLAPATRQISLAPATRQISLAPATRQISLAPATRQISLAPATRQISLAPATRQISLALATRYYTSSSKRYVHVVHAPIQVYRHHHGPMYPGFRSVYRAPGRYVRHRDFVRYRDFVRPAHYRITVGRICHR
jgi:hypothetical protein